MRKHPIIWLNQINYNVLRWLTSLIWVLEKLPVSQLLKNFPEFCGTQVHYHIHKSSRPVSILSQMDPARLLPFYIYKPHFILFFHLRLGLLIGIFTFGFLTQKPTCIPFLHYACYMSCTSNLRSRYHSDFIWRRIRVAKLLTMQFSLTYNYFIPLQSKCFPQHSVLNTFNVCSLLKGPNFTDIQNYRQNYTFK